MELWARRFEIKLGLLDSLWLFFLEDAWMILLQLPEFPQQMVFWMGRNSRCSLGWGWLGQGWRGYSSLGVLEEMGSEAEACHSSQIV